MSESLADRLVEAAEKAIDGHHRSHLGEARDAVAAVLMVLARSGQVAWADSLAALAVEVEKGENR